MSDQSFETEPYSFCIGRCATGFLRVPKGDVINVECLFHTSDIPYQYSAFSHTRTGCLHRERKGLLEMWTSKTRADGASEGSPNAGAKHFVQ
jgi:hypothetical protein